jgi:hypothetical protein
VVRRTSLGSMHRCRRNGALVGCRMCRMTLVVTGSHRKSPPAIHVSTDVWLAMSVMCALAHHDLSLPRPI